MFHNFREIQHLIRNEVGTQLQAGPFKMWIDAIKDL